MPPDGFFIHVEVDDQTSNLLCSTKSFSNGGRCGRIWFQRLMVRIPVWTSFNIHAPSSLMLIWKDDDGGTNI